MEFTTAMVTTIARKTSARSMRMKNHSSPAMIVASARTAIPRNGETQRHYRCDGTSFGISSPMTMPATTGNTSDTRVLQHARVESRDPNQCSGTDLRTLLLETGCCDRAF